jgi:hypothetical protein
VQDAARFVSYFAQEEKRDQQFPEILTEMIGWLGRYLRDAPVTK